VEAETYEGCLERELREKLGLSPGTTPGTYSAAPVVDPPEISLIQYSSRDAKLKQYHFHAYLVTMSGETLFSGREAQRGVRWFPVSALRDVSPKDAQLSSTLSRFKNIWQNLAATDDVAIATAQISAAPGPLS
jgi:ADP-ribose pyrophosphatase YjhB (NUDIX family)